MSNPPYYLTQKTRHSHSFASRREAYLFASDTGLMSKAEETVIERTAEGRFRVLLKIRMRASRELRSYFVGFGRDPDTDAAQEVAYA